MNMQQVLAPDRPEDQCQYWHCLMAIRPFCSQAHETLSLEGEQSPAAAVVVDGMTENQAKLVSLKCVRGKLLNQNTRFGMPLLPVEVLHTPPWLQPAVFDWNLSPLEATREWVFMSRVVPSERLGIYWQHYDTRTTDYRRTRWNWYKKAPAQHTGIFRLTLFSVPNSLLAVYWLLYRPVIPGEKGFVLEVPVPVEKNDPNKEGKPPTGSKRKAIENTCVLSQPILGTASNPLQVCLGSQDYDEKDSKTHNGMDLSKLTTKEMIAKFDLDDNAIDFNGPASALHTSHQHLHQPTLVTVMRMKLYVESLARFEGSSPCGLGELPQVRKIGRAARAIAIMSHPIPKTNDYHAVQIIIPQKQLAHRDMYVFCCSYSHNVAPKGKFIAFVSTDAETDDPQAELKAGIDLLGPVDEIFFYMCDNESASDISTSYDATTHFETTVADVLI